MFAEKKYFGMRHSTVPEYSGQLLEQGEFCVEVVFHNGIQVYRAEFPSARLGNAKRGEYLESMLCSIARRHARGELESEK